MKEFHSVQKKAIGGFALLEVVIAMFVLAVGILGAGALQTASMQSTQGAYYRSQAMFLAGDVLNRMRANRTVASSYVGNTNGTAGSTTCLTNSAGCSPAALATADLGNWIATVKASDLPGAYGEITTAGTNTYVIKITWNENEWQASSYARLSKEKNYTLNVALDNH
jgi:type IV pilus assembly protein PilV